MVDDLKKFLFDSRDHLILFQLLNEEEIEQIVPYLERLSFPEGTILFNEGDPGDYIGFILSGLIEVKKNTEFKGREIVIATLGEGSLIGEMAFINEKETRSATAAALKDTELVLLKRPEFDKLTEKYPFITIKILKALNKILTIRLQKTDERLTSIF